MCLFLDTKVKQIDADLLEKARGFLGTDDDMIVCKFE